jgi:hypothetical protein
MANPHKFRELVKILRKYDPRFEFWENRAKGSERMIYHPDVNGRPESFPVKCHGENTELSVGVISAIIRRFDLPKGLL